MFTIRKRKSDSMERRKSKRIPFFTDANILFEDDFYGGTIGNISENGFECIVTSVTRSLNGILPHKKIVLHYQVASGNEIDLNCEVVWTFKPPLYKKALVMGLKRLNPASDYFDLF